MAAAVRAAAVTGVAVGVTPVAKPVGAAVGEARVRQMNNNAIDHI